MKAIFVLILFVAGCSDSPKALKYRDEQEAACKAACAPREMRSWDNWAGCRCLDK